MIPYITINDVLDSVLVKKKKKKSSLIKMRLSK